MTYDEWEATIPAAVKQDVIWKVQAYRLALYLAACAGEDSREIDGNPRLDQTLS